MTDHRIIPRAEWGARHDNGAGPAPLPARGVRLHHSASTAPDVSPPFDDDFAAVRQLERIGEQRFGRGISYTFVVTPAGLVFEGHGVDRLGAHTKGRNTIERAICLAGNYETMRPTDRQVDACGWLLAHGFLSGWWVAAPLVGGHRDVAATACPGRLAYAAIPSINQRAREYVDGTVAAADELPLPEEEEMDPILAGLLRQQTAEQLVDRWYGQYLGREPDDSGRRAFLARLLRGDDPEEVRRSIAESPEATRRAEKAG